MPGKYVTPPTQMRRLHEPYHKHVISQATMTKTINKRKILPIKAVEL